MGKEDILEGDYFDNSRRFADLCNGVLFAGRTLIKPEELQEADTTLAYVSDKQKVKRIRDKVKRWKGIQIAILVIENQEYVDYRMVFRNMLTEAMEYNRQWKKCQQGHRQKKDLKDRHEYLSGMKAEDTYEPVITLVVYFGTEKEWDGPKTLYHLLDLEDGKELLKPFISNYRLNLFDYHTYEHYEIFCTELRALFEYLSSSRDKEKMAEFMKTNRKQYRNLDEDTVNLLSELTHTEDIKKYKNRVSTGKKGGYDMCKAWEDRKLEGVMEGRTEGENCLGRLMQFLFNDNRIEDAKLAASDENERKRLYREYHIIDDV